MMRFIDDLHPFLVIASKHTFQPNEKSRGIWYTSSVYLVESGNGYLHMNSERYVAVTGTLFYIPPGTWHYWETIDRSLTIRCAFFDWKYTHREGFSSIDDFFLRDFKKYNEKYRGPGIDIEILPYYYVESTKVWLEYFDKFTLGSVIIDHQYFPESLRIRGCFQQFLFQFVQMVMQTKHFIDPRVKRAKLWLEQPEWKCDPQRLKGIAETLGMSYSHFCFLFKRDLGFAPKEYWIKHRLIKSAEDLTTTNLSITEIAEKYGFVDIHYFSKSFRKHLGNCPTAYRVKNKIFTIEYH